MDKELVYNILNGDVDAEEENLPEGMEIADAFEEGSECCRLYEQVYEAKKRLCRRLNTEEDPEIELIIGNMSKIARILDYQMYDYGMAAARCGNGEQ